MPVGRPCYGAGDSLTSLSGQNENSFQQTLESRSKRRYLIDNDSQLARVGNAKQAIECRIYVVLHLLSQPRTSAISWTLRWLSFGTSHEFAQALRRARHSTARTSRFKEHALNQDPQSKRSSAGRSESDGRREGNRADALAAALPGQRKIFSFNEIAEGKPVVIIDLNDQHYQLRLTKSGKLVLNK